jgi:hypothetical protein
MQQRFAGTPMLTFSLLLLAAAGGIGQTPATRGGSVMSQEQAVATPAVAVAAVAGAATGDGAGTVAGAGAHGFDFQTGRWKAHNRRLRARLRGSTEWDEFEATVVARPILGGQGNEDEYRTSYAGGFIGMTFRLFNPATRQWSIYWADSRRGVLDPPVIGSFTGDTGTFEGTDAFEGRPIRVRFIWSRVSTAAPRWEQAFSEDGGKTWETNWIMDFTREGGRQ